MGRDKWFNLLWLLPIGFALLVAAVAIGKGSHNMPAVQAFIQRYPGTDSRGVPPGMRAWEGWTHFFNLFLNLNHMFANRDDTGWIGSASFVWPWWSRRSAGWRPPRSPSGIPASCSGSGTPWSGPCNVCWSG